MGPQRRIRSRIRRCASGDGVDVAVYGGSYSQRGKNGIQWGASSARHADHPDLCAAGVSDVDIQIDIGDDALRIADLGRGGRATVTRGTGSSVAGKGVYDSVGVDHADSVSAGVSNVNVAYSVAPGSAGCADLSGRSGPSIASGSCALSEWKPFSALEKGRAHGATV